MKNKAFTAVELLMVFWILLSLTGVVGYVKNIVRFVNCDFQPAYKAEVVYGIGLIPPIGCITGWISIDDTPHTPAK
ncbi:MAG: hypothetical protein PHU71_06320 [Candidatus Gracilibacteria bacterium]|nr:hypothetical protein [Candidatus Gracilibacteria bacterium]